MPTKELLFSLTAKDFKFDYFRGTGAGGQKRNKTSSGVRCTHLQSGAVGKSDDTRSQHQNKQIAFQRMAETKEFKKWHMLEVARLTGALLEAETYAEREINNPNHTKVEVQKDGKWVVESELQRSAT